MDEVREGIKAANEKFVDAFKQKDAAGIAALYTEDARLLPPDNQMITGGRAIQAFWQGAIDMGIKDAKLETLEVESRDDTAYEIGRFTMNIPSPDGGMTPVIGKYLVVWKRIANSWMLNVDIWNTDAPPQANQG